MAINLRPTIHINDLEYHGVFSELQQYPLVNAIIGHDVQEHVALVSITIAIFEFDILSVLDCLLILTLHFECLNSLAAFSLSKYLGEKNQLN